jgi:hypothetical protein
MSMNLVLITTLFFVIRKVYYVGIEPSFYFSKWKVALTNKAIIKYKMNSLRA